MFNANRDTLCTIEVVHTTSLWKQQSVFIQPCGALLMFGNIALLFAEFIYLNRRSLRGFTASPYCRSVLDCQGSIDRDPIDVHSMDPRGVLGQWGWDT